MYQALYRKWRPRTFDDVIGQDHITKTLKNQIAASRVSHAYLFTGTRGTGKTTCAKLLAYAVNCDHPIDGNPCGECPSCRSILDGSALDILELDAASNTGVDNMRAILEETVYPPANLKKRVYIIDEVHMLSAGAFNALLKTLEEPPDYVMFILATTELKRVAATIQSRCQRFDFKRISQKELTANLSRICTAEEIGIKPDALSLIARLADGSARDSLSLLERCLSQKENRSINLDDVRNALGVSPSEKVDSLARAIAEHDTSHALGILDELYMDGRELRSILETAALYFRDMLLLLTAPNAAAGIISPENDTPEIRQTALMFSPNTVTNIIMQLQKTIDQLTHSTSGRLESEMCLILLCMPSLTNNENAGIATSEHIQSNISNKPISVTKDTKVQKESENIPNNNIKSSEDAFDFHIDMTDGPAPLSDDDAPPWEENTVDLIQKFEDIPEPVPEMPSPNDAESTDKSVKTTNKQSSISILDDIRKKELIDYLKPYLSRSVSTYLILSKIFIPDTELIISVESDIARILLDKNNIKSTISDAVKQLWNETRTVKVCVGEPELDPKPKIKDGFSQIINSGRDAGIKIDLI